MTIPTQLGIFLLALAAACFAVAAAVWTIETRRMLRCIGEWRGEAQTAANASQGASEKVFVEVWEPAPRGPVSAEELADLELEYGRAFTVEEARALRRRQAARDDVADKLKR